MLHWAVVKTEISTNDECGSTAPPCADCVGGVKEPIDSITMKTLISLFFVQGLPLGKATAKAVKALLLAVFLESLLAGCATAHRSQSGVEVIRTNTLTSAKGKTYRVLVTAEQDRFFETEREAHPPATAARMAMSGDDFAGNDRKAAKTSISSGPAIIFTNLADLLASLPPDDNMLNHTPQISKASDSQRVVEEETNVTVEAFIFAAKGESDNDFHLILGNTPDPGSAQFMNAEISGLPADDPFRTQLSGPRQDFKNFFGDQVPGGGGYQRYDPPIPVRVSGSQFYDIDHKPGAVGPRDMAPSTAWEIHPISAILFETPSQ